MDLPCEAASKEAVFSGLSSHLAGPISVLQQVSVGGESQGDPLAKKDAERTSLKLNFPQESRIQNIRLSRDELHNEPRLSIGVSELIEPARVAESSISTVHQK